MSIAGGLHKAIKRAQSIETTALQVFLKNNNQWNAKDYTEEIIENYRAAAASFKYPIIAHSGYLINPAGTDDKRKKSFYALVDEVNRASELGISAIVIHPGNHLNQGLDIGIKKAAEFFDNVFDEAQCDNVQLYLETTAGQGTSIGHRFEYLRDIIGQSKNQSRFGICLDTCHIFAAGYDFKSKETYEKTKKDYNHILGKKSLKVIHFNDSKKEYKSHVDRHEHIGKGYIGIEGLSHFLIDKDHQKIPFIMETPKKNELEEDEMNYKTVLSLFNKHE